MPDYRSRTTTHGRNMAGARGLWRATGISWDVRGWGKDLKLMPFPWAGRL